MPTHTADPWLTQVRQTLLAQHPARAAFLRGSVDAAAGEDIDLLVFDDGDDVRVQRLAPQGGLPSLDLMCLPAALLQAPARLAAFGLVTHRLLGSTLLHDDSGHGATALAQVHTGWREPGACSSRIEAFLELARLTVQEVGVSREHPAIAMFWLHMAHAACVGALCDAAGLAAPNVYTRPLEHAARVEPFVGTELAAPMARTLRLHDNAAALEAPLRALHALVQAHCPEPAWPVAMREGTRSEFRYWRATGELQARLDAARGLPGPAAVFYLRYTAYSLVRVAMVHARVAEGDQDHVPFVRPERRVGPDLAQHLPAALPLFEALLGGHDSVDLAGALHEQQALRALTLAFLARQGVAVQVRAPWVPYGEPPAS
jgi:hypothetical protein